MTAFSTKLNAEKWADNFRTNNFKINFDTKETDTARLQAAISLSNLNIQEYIKTDYKGRVLLELFQNADDAANLSKDKNKNKIKVISDGRILKILNQGIVFTENTLEKIIYPARSDKKEEDRQTTGSKGIGFRSVLNWSDDIKIYSGDFAVRFSKSKSTEEIQNKYKGTPIYQSMIKEDPEWIHKVNFLTYPFSTEFPTGWISGKGYLDNDNTYYDTCIEIKLNDSGLEEYLSAKNDFLNKQLLSMLFFLKISHIYFETIDINTNEKDTIHLEINKTESDIVNGLEHCIATLSNDGEDKKFYMFKQDTETIAVPFDFATTNSYKIFATFPIEDQHCPFPVIMNGRKFKITSNRNSFIENEQVNFDSVKKLQNMLITKIAPYFTQHQFGSQALEMVTYHDIESTIFKNEVKNIDAAISTQEIIQTTNGEYHKISDILGEITYNTIPDFLINEADCRFILQKTHELLCFSDNLYQQIQKIKPSILCNFINNKSTNWSPERRVSTLLFWLDSVYSKYSPETHILPHLIKTQRNGFYTYSKEKVPYFYSGTDVTEIPKWLDLMIIDSDDQKELFSQFKLKHPEDLRDDPIDRAIAHKYKEIKPFWYMDKTGLRTEINSQIKGDFNRAIDSIKFVYANYKNDSKQTTDSNEWFVPCANGGVLKPNQTYFGTEYTDDPLISRICESAKLIPIASPEQFSLSNDEIKEFVETIKSHLNIRDNILPEESNISDSYYKDQAKIQIQQQHPDFENVYISSQEGITIPELDNILKNAEQPDILEWLTKYICPRLSETEQITCNYSYRRKKTENTTCVQMDNYIIHKLKNTDWLTINNKKIAPKYCLIQKRNSSYVFPSDLIPFLPQYDTYKNLWDLLKSNQYIHQLPDNAFYNILLKLPEFDTNGKLSKYIYSQIAKESEQQDLDILIHSDCEEKKSFFQIGQLWAKNKYDTGKFYPVSDGVYYTSGNVLNIENKPIMETPQRNGKQENFQQIFNVRKFEENIIASYDKSIRHPKNDKFGETFEDFKKILNALNETANLTNALPTLGISLVSEIHLSNTDEILPLNDYEIIPTDKQNKYFIKLQKHQQPKDLTIGEIIGDICNKISNSKDISDTINMLYEIKDDKEQLIARLKKRGGNIDLLDEYKDIKQLFKDAALEICPGTNIEELLQVYPINFDNFTSSENTESIIQILTTLNLDVKDFENVGFNDINLKNHNKQKLEKFIFDNKDNYKISLYENLLQKPTEQHSFYIKIKEFENLTKTTEIPNSRDYNPKKLIPFSKPINNTIDIDKIYDKNLQDFKQECNDEDIIDEMLNNLEVQANILFGNFDQLKKTYKDKLDKNTANTKEIQEKELQNTSIMKISNLKIADYVANTKKEEEKKSTHTKTRFDKSSINHKQKSGLIAEYEAYKAFKEKYGENKTKWFSSNAEKYNVIPQGHGNDSLGYDMSYQDKKGIIKYVEVKNATHDTNTSYSFLISANEIQCWETNKDNYEIALVNKESGCIQILSGSDLEKCITNAETETKKCIVPFDTTLPIEE